MNAKSNMKHQSRLRDDSHSSTLTASAGRLLEAKGLGIGYVSGQDVVRDVDLNIYQGTVTMILGRSGSGKTTLLKGIARLIKVSRGSLNWESGARPSREPRIAYIPQTLGLIRSSTTLENTLIGTLRDVPRLRSLFNFFPAAVRKKAERILVDLGLADKIDVRVSRLSGGQRQRVAIARALIQDPEIILADEFVSQLDAITTEEILVMMRDLAARGISFLVTTHDTDLVERFADRVVMMRDGAIVLDGDAATVSSQKMISLMK
jgi:phosphonate transport system ATP-binding protein